MYMMSIGGQLAQWTSACLSVKQPLLISLLNVTFSDDIFKSRIHRAINRRGVRRYFIPLFLGTDYDVWLEVCLHVLSRFYL